MRNIEEYIDISGNNPFEIWHDKLNAQAAAKITVALYRMEQGNLSNTKSVGAGTFEYKIDYGPGYRIYFGKDGEKLIILLGGGTKKRQGKDIDEAKARWKKYKKRKKTKQVRQRHGINKTL